MQSNSICVIMCSIIYPIFRYYSANSLNFCKNNHLYFLLFCSYEKTKNREIRQMSVKEIINPMAYDEFNNPTSHGI